MHTVYYWTPTGGVALLQDKEIVTRMTATSRRPAKDLANEMLCAAEIQTTRVDARFLTGDFRALVSLIF